MDWTKKLVVAAEQGALEDVKEALQAGTSPDAMGPNSGALHVAAHGRHKAVVQLLLEAGANPNLADQQSFYPLHLAASQCAEDICHLLLQAGAQVDALTSQQGTPLHVGAATGCPAVIKVLLDNGAHLEAKDAYGATPLLVAANEGKAKIIQQLLDAGATAHARDKNEETALIKAARRLLQTRIHNWEYIGQENGQAVRYHITKGGFRKTIPYDARQPQELGQLLSFEQQYQYALEEWGPRQHVHYLDALASIQILMEAGGDLNATNIVGHSALWMACSAGEAKIIKALYQRGASFDAVEDNGEFKGATCLHKVAASGRLDGLEAYLELNPYDNINVPDYYGWTPLHYLADMGGLAQMAFLLLAKGADKAAASELDRGDDFPKGMLPYQVALHWKDQAMAAILKP